MTVAELTTRFKGYMRITHDKLDDVISADIMSGALDLERAGVSAHTDDEIRDDELVVAALRLYTMALEDYNAKGQQYMQQYGQLRDAMSLCETYREADDAQ